MDALTAPRMSALSQSEFAFAIRHLSNGEKTALVKIARLYARRTPFDHQDLLHEAITRVLGGRRTWPRHISVTLFLGGVIRSVAWEWRSERAGGVEGAIDVAAQERNANAAIDARKIIALFDDDPIARKVVIGMLDGARGEELQAISGLGKTEYESKRTKIRRRIEKLFQAER